MLLQLKYEQEWEFETGVEKSSAIPRPQTRGGASVCGRSSETLIGLIKLPAGVITAFVCSRIAEE